MTKDRSVIQSKISRLEERASRKCVKFKWDKYRDPHPGGKRGFAVMKAANGQAGEELCWEGGGVGGCPDGRSLQASSEPWQQTKPTILGCMESSRARTVWEVFITLPSPKTLCTKECAMPHLDTASTFWCLQYTQVMGKLEGAQGGCQHGWAGSSCHCHQRLGELGLCSLEQTQLGGT